VVIKRLAKLATTSRLRIGVQAVSVYDVRASVESWRCSWLVAVAEVAYSFSRSVTQFLDSQSFVCGGTIVQIESMNTMSLSEVNNKQYDYIVCG
jgi:hypothetical protein